MVEQRTENPRVGGSIPPLGTTILPIGSIYYGPTEKSERPFCSERCRDVDLNRWLSNSYAIPGKPEDDEDAE